MRAVLAVAVAVLITACFPTPRPPNGAPTFPTSPPPETEPTPLAARETLEPITVPVSAYILDDDDGQLSSVRSVDEVKAIFERANTIWSQAGIVLQLKTVERISLPGPYMQAIAAGDFQAFFAGARGNRAFHIPQPSLINGFFASNIGGPNGIAPFGTRAFFVTDVPSVHHERVTAHEVGHILGLHHTLADMEQLLYPGTNGTVLTVEEITVARYAARGLLAGLR